MDTAPIAEMSGFAGHINSWLAITCHEKANALYIDVRLRRTHIYLARYRSPGKDCQIAGTFTSAS